MSQNHPSLGKFVWRDLMSTDTEASIKFYTELLGWRTEQHDMGSMGPYTMLYRDTDGLGGVVPLDPAHGVPSHWMSYVSVQDLDATLARVPELGGKVCVPASDIPNIGRFAVVEDPLGAVVSPYQGLNAPPADYKEPAGPGTFVWSELLTTDPARASQFYAALFGWDVQTHDMGGQTGLYWLFKLAGKDFAGSLTMPPGAEMRPYWLPYVGVEDVDGAARRAEELGGKLCVPPRDIPGIGRFSVVADTTGASFALYKDSGAHA